MKYFIIFLSALFLMSCSPKQALNDSPLGYSFMPSYLNLDTLGPKIPSDPSKVVDTSFQDFKTIQIKAGTYYLKVKTDSLMTLPAGSLISEKKAALYVFYEAEYQRLKTQLFYTNYLNKQYYNSSLSAEKLYQDEIVRLRKETKRSWLEQNSIYIGFACGIVTAVLTEYAVIKLSK